MQRCRPIPGTVFPGHSDDYTPWARCQEGFLGTTQKDLQGLRSTLQHFHISPWDTECRMTIRGTGAVPSKGLWTGYKRSWSLLNSRGREQAVITLVLSPSTVAQTRTFWFCGGEQQQNKRLVPLKQGACKSKLSLKGHSSASSGLALGRRCASGLLGESNSERESRKGRDGAGKEERKI